MTVETSNPHDQRIPYATRRKAGIPPSVAYVDMPGRYLATVPTIDEVIRVARDSFISMQVL